MGPVRAMKSWRVGGVGCEVVPATVAAELSGGEDFVGAGGLGEECGGVRVAARAAAAARRSEGRRAGVMMRLSIRLLSEGILKVGRSHHRRTECAMMGQPHIGGRTQRSHEASAEGVIRFAAGRVGAGAVEAAPEEAADEVGGGSAGGAQSDEA